MCPADEEMGRDVAGVHDSIPRAASVGRSRRSMLCVILPV